MKVLRKRQGDSLAAGLLGASLFGPAPGSLGRAFVRRLDAEGMVLDYEAEAEAPSLAPLRLLLGFPRPIQASRLLRDLASLGLAEILLSGTELGEKSYLESDLWKKEEWRQAILEGAEQAANPRLPRVERAWTLERALGTLAGAAAGPGEPDWKAGGFVVLHPGEDLPDLGSLPPASPLTLAIGSERGWTERELDLLDSAGFVRAGLGSRILKTETAAIAASALALSRLGLL